MSLNINRRQCKKWVRLLKDRIYGSGNRGLIMTNLGRQGSLHYAQKAPVIYSVECVDIRAVFPGA